MTIYTRCQCQALLQGPEEFAGKRALCPACGAQTLFPTLPPVRRATEAVAAVVTPEPAPSTKPSAAPPADGGISFDAPQPGTNEDIVDVIEFLDPPEPPLPRAPSPSGGGVPPIKPAPKATVPAEPEEPWAARMLEAMLDPRAIQWLLMIGGGLMVIGLLIFLISQGIFKDPRIVSAFLIGGSLALLGGGWYFKLKTDYQTAGRAIAFLACVVLPLNLWYLNYAQLETIDASGATVLQPLVPFEHLWIGGALCTLLYIATVIVLRDPIFMYAVEIGVTLTVVLLLRGPIQLHADGATELSLALLLLGLISIHLERAFMAEGEFRREEYGLPLFWSGHGQLAAALFTLLGSEALAWMSVPDRAWINWVWKGNLLSDDKFVAAGIWAAGAYAYLYSDLVVRRTGVYAYLAAVCVLFAVGTLLADQNAEVIMIVLALSSVVCAMGYHALAKGDDDRLSRALPPLTLLLGTLPLLIGIVLHIRDTNPEVARLWPRPTDIQPWLFVAAMAIIMAANRVAAYLFEEKEEGYATAFYFLSGGAAIIGAASLLRLTGRPELMLWEYQAPILILIPIAYLVAARMYRGRRTEELLGAVAHAGTAAIVISGLFSKLGLLPALLQPQQFTTTNLGLEWSPTLLLALLFAETAVFYGLAAIFRRRSLNIYFFTAAVCLSLWQLIGYWGIDPPYYTLFFALLGTGLHVAAFFVGLAPVDVFDREGKKDSQLAGPGLVAFQCANAILLVACIAAAWQGLVKLGGPVVLDGGLITSILLTALCSLVALCLVPSGGWRQVYVVAAVVLGVIGGLHLYRYLDLQPARKVEIVCVVAGVILLIVSLIGRYRRSTERPDDLPGFGLSLGSLLVIVPLFIAMIVMRFHPAFDAKTGEALLSMPDELALVTAGIVMLLSGLVLRIRATTILGGIALVLHLLIIIGTVLHQAQVMMGVYLAIGGGLIFAGGVALSIYRDRILALPEQIKNREGVFQVLDWT